MYYKSSSFSQDNFSYPPGSGDPGSQGSYPPFSVGFQPGPGPYPPTFILGSYPPDQGGYRPAQGGYPPAQCGYPPAQGGYPPAQGGYPPAQGGYPPAQGGYPPAQGGYPPAQGGYPPAQGGYPQPQRYIPPPPGQPPISQQPMSGGQPQINEGGWMTLPTGPPANCPPGLEYLTTIDQLLVHQKVEIIEVLTCFETKNKFTVKNGLGQKVFYAVEESNCCIRNCCGPLRPFGMKILDNFENEVMYLKRRFACDSCLCPCFLQKMKVYSPPGCLVGSVEQKWSVLFPSFNILDSAGDTVLRIKGPICTYSICGRDVEFQVLSKDGQTIVGRISKQWSGLLREIFTDADYFGIIFPMDLDVRMKAVMLGACFLIDAMFFEKCGHEEEDTPGML